MAGLLVDDSNNLTFKENDDQEFAFSAFLDPPTAGDQTANVVITGNSSSVVFIECDIGDGAGTSPKPPAQSPLTEGLIPSYNFHWIFCGRG